MSEVSLNGGNTARWRQENHESATNGEQRPSQGSVGFTGWLLTASKRFYMTPGEVGVERLQAQRLITVFNPLNTKRGLLYLKTQFVPRSKHFSSRL